MTNEQLYLLLQSMLNELAVTTDLARSAMPEDAPKMQWTDGFGKPKEGDFEAIEPFNVLWDAWNSRIELALGKDKTE